MVFLDFFVVLCTVRLWPKSHFFQNMHRLVTPKLKTLWGQRSCVFWIFRGSKIISVGNFLTPHFFCEMRTFRNSINSSFRMLTLHCIFMKIHSATFSQLIQFNLTQYTSFSHNYGWRKKCGFLYPKSPKKWRNLSSKSFRFWGHQSMHGLKKVRFRSKSHCTEDLKKVQNHQYRFRTVEKRFWFRSRSA